MSEDSLYTYRLFTTVGVFNVLSKIETRDELWNKIVSSSDVDFEEELFHVDGVGRKLGGVNIRPSIVEAIDTPFGASPVENPENLEIARNQRRMISRRSANRVIIKQPSDSSSSQPKKK